MDVMDKLSREFLIMLVLAFRLESRPLDSSSAVERSSHGYNYEISLEVGKVVTCSLVKSADRVLDRASMLIPKTWSRKGTVVCHDSFS